MCGGDVASYKFPLFRSYVAHTSVCGKRLWRAVADPRHRVAWLCVEDPRTRATVAERQTRAAWSEEFEHFFFFLFIHFVYVWLGQVSSVR